MVLRRIALAICVGWFNLLWGCNDEQVGGPDREEIGAGGEGPGSSDLPGGPRACREDTDCANTQYPALVETESDCYCPVCPGDFGRLDPLNRNVHDQYRNAWASLCLQWSIDNLCPPFPCPVVASPVCLEGLCSNAEPE